MRVGQNPIKSVEKIKAPSEVTVLVLSYIPFIAGYYQESLDVLKRSLESIRSNTEGDYDLMVFDNASCREVTEYLQEQKEKGHIDFLVLSKRNIGKSGAWNMAFAAAPGKYIAYSDSDIFFHPAWLKAHLKAFEDFPEAGMVTGMPLMTPKESSQSTIQYAKKNKTVEFESGEFITFEDLWRHARSLGMTKEDARDYHAKNLSHRLTVQGHHYYVGAGHFQFVAPKKILDELLPLPSQRPMGRVRLLDQAIDKAGYLRLSLPDWYVHHMGNTLPQADINQVQMPERKNSLPKIFRRPLQWLYNKIFQLIYKS